MICNKEILISILLNQSDFKVIYLSKKDSFTENYQGQMHLVELEIKYTTGNNTFASYLDLLMSIRREVTFTLPFLTNMAISISI